LVTQTFKLPLLDMTIYSRPHLIHFAVAAFLLSSKNLFFRFDITLLSGHWKWHPSAIRVKLWVGYSELWDINDLRLKFFYISECRNRNPQLLCILFYVLLPRIILLYYFGILWHNGRYNKDVFIISNYSVGIKI